MRSTHLIIDARRIRCLRYALAMRSEFALCHRYATSQWRPIGAPLQQFDWHRIEHFIANDDTFKTRWQTV